MDYKKIIILLIVYALLFLWIYIKKPKKSYVVIGILFVLFIIIYFNRLELKQKVTYKNDTYYLYQNWFKSTEYFLDWRERSFADNYYVLKKNDHLICKFKYSFGYAEGIYPFPIISLNNDSILEITTIRSDILRIKIPVDKKNITQEDVMVIYNDEIVSENEKKRFIEFMHFSHIK